MRRLQRAVVLLRLADELRARGSWCGETHIQKATYFLQELFGVPTEYGFLLYKHGPFSFELRDELTAMRADGLMELLPQPPYGPSLVATPAGRELEREYPKTLKKYKKEIDFVANQLGRRDVSELERLATALFVTLQGGDASVEERAEEITYLKPHIDLQSAEAAVNKVEQMRHVAKRL